MRPRATSLLYTTHAGLACKSAIRKERKNERKEPQELPSSYYSSPSSSAANSSVCCSVLLFALHAIASFRAFERLATSFIRRTTATATATTTMKHKAKPKSTMTNAATASVRFLCPLCLGTLHALSLLMDAPLAYTQHTTSNQNNKQHAAAASDDEIIIIIQLHSVVEISTPETW